ncbi:hypothetical protein C7459_109124 [Tumebacillus permanentifrigoris]|uniref:Uncharacterized protein n=1 Tax=Tumebacillus permanentifrigoris TaxID=378543 RepID=A0A316D7Q1_9BACL|nr:hypothetical protein C7459_109124 [Tumebacillus permanentifrigoris]
MKKVAKLLEALFTLHQMDRDYEMYRANSLQSVR